MKISGAVNLLLWYPYRLSGCTYRKKDQIQLNISLHSSTPKFHDEFTGLNSENSI